jgi:metallo-beta-lactamase family protein
MRLTFCGGAGKVTGANYLLETESAKVLIDCGIEQGSRLAEQSNYTPFPYDPRTIDALIFTHAHLDHTGRAPKLVRGGFKGKIFGTHPTIDLARIVLDDSIGLVEEESSRHGHPPLFTEKDVIEMWKLTHGVRYHERTEVAPGVWMELLDAGHILGSSMVVLDATEGGKTQRITFSGDLGNAPNLFLRSPEVPPGGGVLLVESTYGDRVHETHEERKKKLIATIERTITRGGTLMIPAFAIERTQGLLYELNALVENRRIPRVPVFLDSPMAIKATAVYEQYLDYLNEEARKLIKSGDDLFDFPGLSLTLGAEASKAINEVPPPKIIIAGSGMSEGGRILHHEKRYLSDQNSTLLIFGFQSYNTLGRRLLEGARAVRIHGESVPVRAEIVAIGGYSAHADQQQILSWVKDVSPPPQQVFTIQGEPQPALALALKIKDMLHIPCEVPIPGEIFEL